MKQYTIRFEEREESELEKIKEMQGLKSSQAAMEHAVVSYRWLVESERIAEKRIQELEAVVKYLEEQLKKR